MYINSDKHYKRAAMTRIRTPYRSTVCVGLFITEHHVYVMSVGVAKER